MRETSEYTKLRDRKFREYSVGHRRCYIGPIELIKSTARREISVLDVGSGIGYGHKQMIERGLLTHQGAVTYLGIERDADSVAYHAGNNDLLREDNSSLIIGDFLTMEDSAFPLPKYDYTFCIEVIEHVPAPQQVEFFEKLIKRTERILFLSTPEADKNPHGTLVKEQVLAMCNYRDCQVVCLQEHWTTLYIIQPNT